MATAREHIGRAETPSLTASDHSEYSDVQQAAHDQLSREVHQKQRQRSRTPPSRLGFEPVVGYTYGTLPKN
jgi:hypothetical protein